MENCDDLIREAAAAAAEEWATDFRIDANDEIDRLVRILRNNFSTALEEITATWPADAHRLAYLCAHPGVSSFEDCPYCGMTVLLDDNGDEIAC